MIVLIDYGMGNLRSVQKSFDRLNSPIEISSDEKKILNADKIVLPGIGNFERGIVNLKSNGLFEILNEAVLLKKIPILGICLGMQLMTDFSEEGNVEGFGWVKAITKRFTFNTSELKIPHMGWNNLNVKNDAVLLTDIDENDFFYFVHSYYVICECEHDILTETSYGDRFVSSFNKNNIYGCQFHPEKSHDAGLLLLRNFVKV